MSLKGIPDIPYSLPCRNEYDETRKVSSAFDKVKTNVFPTSNFEILKDGKKYNLPHLLKGRKASEVFLEYVGPLLDKIIGEGETDLGKIEYSLRIPWMVWNASIIDQYKKTTQMKEIKKIASKIPYGHKMINFYKKRKKDKFDDYKYLMGEFKLIPQNNGNFNLRMESRDISSQ